MISAGEALFYHGWGGNGCAVFTHGWVAGDVEEVSEWNRDFRPDEVRGGFPGPAKHIGGRVYIGPRVVVDDDDIRDILAVIIASGVLDE